MDEYGWGRNDGGGESGVAWFARLLKILTGWMVAGGED